MSTDLRINTSVDDQRLQQLFAKQAQIQAQQDDIQAQIASQIASLTSSAPPTSSQYQRSPIHKQPHRRSNVARSLSTNGATMGRQLSSVGLHLTFHS